MTQASKAKEIGRKYGNLRRLEWAISFLGVAVFVLGTLGAIVFGLAGAQNMNFNTYSGELTITSVPLRGIIVGALTEICVLLAAILLLGFSDSVRLFLDMAKNQQRTAEALERIAARQQRPPSAPEVKPLPTSGADPRR